MACSFIAALIEMKELYQAESTNTLANQFSSTIWLSNFLRLHYSLFFALPSSHCSYFSPFSPLSTSIKILVRTYLGIFYSVWPLSLSVAAMLLCFSWGHFLTQENSLKCATIPIYGLTCSAVTYFALQQLPSYVVLVKATFQNVPERLNNEDPL